MEGLRCAASGSGNVWMYCAEKLMSFGAKVMTTSDSNGVLLFEDGMTKEDWDTIVECKQVQRGRLSSLEGKTSGKYIDKETPWSLDVKYDLALPCATQNEIKKEDAERLIKNGVLGVTEGANLPTSLEAQEVLRDHPNVLYIPGKASNAGGVAVSGMEMSQNAQRLTWTREEVDEKLQSTMSNIYKQMEDAAGEGGTLEQGANRAGFIKVAKASKELGWLY
jgi:glutamate dehydrogenase (NADP+)